MSDYFIILGILLAGYFLGRIHEMDYWKKRIERGEV